MILCVALNVLFLVNSIWDTGNRNSCDPLFGLVCVVVGKFDLGDSKNGTLVILCVALNVLLSVNSI